MSNFNRLSSEPPRPDEYIPPVAHSFQVNFCGHCPNAHILLLDAEGRGFAQMTMNLEQAVNLLVAVKGFGKAMEKP